LAATLLGSCPVPYRLLNKSSDLGSYEGSGDLQSQTETLNFRVALADKNAFITWALGYSAVVSGAIVRTQPLQCPFAANLYCTRYRFRAIGADNRVSLARPWPDTIISLEFNSIAWNPNGPSPYVSVRYRASTSTATIPGAKLHFSNGEYIDHDYGILIGQFAIEITRHQVPDMGAFLSTYLPLSGQVNSDTITIRNYSYGPGYLLMPSLDGSESMDTQLNLTTDATISVIYRSIGWNNDVRSDGAVDSVVPPPYLTTAFSGAFS
jgi:hypothetical protein